MDLSQTGAAALLMANIARHGESVDLLINNAGFGLTGRFADLEGLRQREMIDLNCGALAELAHAVLPGMITAKAGGILNVASTAAFQPGPGMAVYFATKAFVLSFSEALHDEVKGRGIRVSCLCPGPTQTEFRQVSGFDPKGPIGKLSADAASVVRTGLSGLERNKAVVVPGLVNKAISQVNRFLPRVLVRRAARMVKP
jgi:short-subunit dehydrogenase